MSEVSPAWTTAQRLVDSIEPCDIIEIRYEKAKPPKSHFILNIRKGWCVHVIPTVDSRSRAHRGREAEGHCYIYEGFKDAIDFLSLAGRNPCRINNLEDVAKAYNLTPRSRKDALQIARAGLAEGAVNAAIKSAIPGDPGNPQDISRQFSLYWKYNGAAADAEIANKFLDKVRELLCHKIQNEE